VLRRLAVVTLAALAVTCSSSTSNRTITVGSDKVPVAELVDAHAGLCEAATHLDQARALFFDRSHTSLHTVARALEDVDRAQAASLLEAKQKVESELTTPPPTLRDDLLRLADVYRSGLGRLAITAPPCDK
jgi:hypothetical protein